MTLTTTSYRCVLTPLLRALPVALYDSCQQSPSAMALFSPSSNLEHTQAKNYEDVK